MTKLTTLMGAVCVWNAGAALSHAADQPEGPSHGTRSAPQLVREGNRRLTNEQPAEALELYEQAEAIRPDAREIAFVRGLGHFQLGEWEQARDAFREAAIGSDALADDALYSLGTCDHAEALAAEQDPQTAISKLENAMRTYHDVLQNNPRHEAARDANVKAATLWRQVKQQLEQQQQQQNQQQESPNEENEQQEQDPSQAENTQEQTDAEQQPEPSSAPRTEDEQQEQAEQEPQQTAEQNEQQQQDSQAQTADQKPDEKEQQQVSREQAQRKLREMIQALRERQKNRDPQVEPVRVVAPEKDW